jgi:ABC-type sulfate transport system permease component
MREERPGVRPRATFQPRITISLLYFLMFFVAILWLIALPALLEVAQTVPPGPEQQEAAREAARAAVRPRLLAAFLLALAFTAIGIYTGWLPGTRRPDSAP